MNTKPAPDAVPEVPQQARDWIADLARGAVIGWKKAHGIQTSTAAEKDLADIISGLADAAFARALTINPPPT